MGWFDVHAHLTHEQLLPDLEGILERAAQRGVTTIISNGLNPSDNLKVLELSRRYDLVKAAIGLYPVDAVLEQMRADGVDYPGQRDVWPTADAVCWVAKHAADAFAIGEIGLDGYWVPEKYWPQQESAFCDLVKIAQQADKPVIIHTRKRERRTLELLDDLGAQRVNWHCFGSRVKLARQIAERGHFLSIPANARRSESFTRMLQTLPRTQLLLKTDCPYLGPDREQSNEPANVCGTAEYAAELWGVELPEVERQLSENFRHLFGVSP